MNDAIFEGNIIGAGNHNDSTTDTAQEAALDCEVMEDDGSGNHEDATSRLFDFLTRTRNIMPDDDDDTSDDSDDMDADDIHNKAVNHARHGKKKKAAELCMKGLERLSPSAYEESITRAEISIQKSHPVSLNVDLLSDTIQYSSDTGDMLNAAKHYAVLKESIPVQRWNWRAFTFAFDYLLKEDPIGNEKECRTLVENYQKYLPHEEKASMAESELEAALGNAENSMNVLKESIRVRSNASQCALRLADMQMNRGLYEDVISTTNYGIAASAETQPSINIPYLYYLRALAKDHILHEKECTGETISKDELSALAEEYKLLISEFPELRRHSHTIEMRAKMLKFVKAAD